MNTIRIGVDHGYRNMKTANTCFPSAICELPEKPDDLQDILEYEGKYYSCNAKNIVAVDNHDKSQSKEFYLLTLAAIAKELKARNAGSNNMIVRVPAGLPQKWYLSQKSAFRDMLSRNDKLEFSFEGTQYNLVLSMGKIFMQGHSACIRNLMKYKDEYCVIVDIGGETIDIIAVDKGKIDHDNCHIDTHAMIWLYNDIADAIRSQCYEEVNATYIENYIESGSAAAPTTNKYQAIIQDRLIQYTDMVFSILKEFKFNLDITPVIFAGGGEKVIRQYGSYDGYILDFVDDIHANAKGYELLDKNYER